MPTSYVDVVTASSVGLPARTLVRTDRNNVAPRLGVAYRPFGNADTVIRGGYGLYYDMLPIELRRQRAVRDNGNPFTNPTVPMVVLPRCFRPAGSGPATIALPLAINPDLSMPYTHQSNVTVEHERWNTGFRVSYVATLGREMWYQRDINAPVPDDRLYVNKPRPFPQFPEIIYADNGATHDYHGVTFEAERRMRTACSCRRPTPRRGIWATPGERSERRHLHHADRESVRPGARARPRSRRPRIA